MLYDLQIISAGVHHLEQSHTQPLFLFPIVFGINFCLVVASRIEIMAAPRSRQRKSDGQLSISSVFQGNQVRKRPGAQRLE